MAKDKKNKPEKTSKEARADKVSAKKRRTAHEFEQDDEDQLSSVQGSQLTSPQTLMISKKKAKSNPTDSSEGNLRLENEEIEGEKETKINETLTTVIVRKWGLNRTQILRWYSFSFQNHQGR